MAGRRQAAARRVCGWLQAAHPFPLTAVLCLTALIGLVSADGEPPAGRFLLVLAAMLLSQLAIGWTNDYLDRESDRVHQPAKPVAAGLVEARWLPPASLIALGSSFAAGIPLGREALLLLVAGTACGFAYNAVLKGTALSWLPYVVALSLLPLFVWSALDVYRGDFLWLYCVGWPLPVAAHLANSLPDLDTDRDAGRRGLAVRLGRTRAVALLALAAGAPVALTLLSLLWLDYALAVLVPVLAAYLALLLLAALGYRRRPLRAGAVLAFRLLVAAALVFTTGWLAAV